MRARLFSAATGGLVILLIALGVWGWAVRDPAKAAFERSELRRQRNQTELVPNTFFNVGYCNVIDQTLVYADPEQPPSIQEQQASAPSLRPLFEQLVVEAPPELQPSAQELANAWTYAVAAGDDQALLAPEVEAARQALQQYRLQFCQ